MNERYQGRPFEEFDDVPSREPDIPFGHYDDIRAALDQAEWDRALACHEVTQNEYDRHFGLTPPVDSIHDKDDFTEW